MKNLIPKILLFLLFFYCSFFVIGRNNIDSMEKSLAQHKEDTAKANLIIKICVNYLDLDDDKVAAYAKELLTLSNKIDYCKGKAEAYSLMGIVADNKSQYVKALDLYDTSLSLALKCNEPMKQANAENNIALIMYKIGNNQKALSYYFSAQKIFEHLNQKKQLANVLSNIGLVYSNMHEGQKNLDYQFKALAIRKQLDDDYGLASTYTNVALAYSSLDHTNKSFLDSSLLYQFEAARLHEKINDNYGLAISYTDIASDMITLKKYEVALQYLQKTIPIREKLGDKHGLTHTYTNMGKAYNDLNKGKEALFYAQKALALSLEIKSDVRTAKAYETLSEIYSKTGDFKNAYRSDRAVTVFLQKVYDADKSKQAEELAVKYEVEKKDLMLKKNEAELKSRMLVIQQKNTQLISLILLLMAGAATAYLLYNHYRWKHEAKLKANIIHHQDQTSKAVIAAEEQERKRIASDLHDGLGQLFSAVKMNLSNISNAIVFTDASSKLTYEKTVSMVDESCREIRSISHQMMPNVLLKFGLSTALRDFINKIDNKKMEVRFESYGLNERLDANTETVLYRVIQESVNNVIKHADATRLFIQLHKEENNVSVTIEDNGKGFDPADADKFTGIGLKNMRSRIEFLKGNVSFDSTPGHGTVVIVEIPIETIPDREG